MPRYELRFGQFGPYFFDTKDNKPMGLYEVLCELNQFEDDGHYSPTHYGIRLNIAKKYHEMCREMVNRQIGMITKPTQPYLEWEQLTQDQIDGRLFIAEQIMKDCMGIHYPDMSEYWNNWKPSKK